MTDYLETYFMLEYILQSNYGWTYSDDFSEDKECIICLDTLKNNVVATTGCGHSFHCACIYINMIKYDRYACPEAGCKKKFEFANKNI